MPLCETYAVGSTGCLNGFRSGWSLPGPGTSWRKAFEPPGLLDGHLCSSPATTVASPPPLRCKRTVIGPHRGMWTDSTTYEPSSSRRLDVSGHGCAWDAL